MGQPAESSGETAPASEGKPQRLIERFRDAMGERGYSSRAEDIGILDVALENEPLVIHDRVDLVAERLADLEDTRRSQEAT